MALALAILTYFAYAFIIFMDARKAIKYAKMPVHLRWDLYPMVRNGDGSHDTAFRQGTQSDKNRGKRFIKSFLFILKDNFYLGEYFHKNRRYWCVLFPWHVGFLLILTFNGLCFLAAFSTFAGLSLPPEPSNLVGRSLYYAILVTGFGSFIIGSLGSIGMLTIRLASRELRAYASPINYFNYVFLLAVFSTGFYAGYSFDPTFSEYRGFWKGLVTLSPIDVHFAWAIHIILFALVKLYLPFTRSMHYVTRFFAFLWVYWDDRPNVKGSAIEKAVQGSMDHPVSWSAPHIPSGKRWSDLNSQPAIPGSGEVRR